MGKISIVIIITITLPCYLSSAFYMSGDIYIFVYLQQEKYVICDEKMLMPHPGHFGFLFTCSVLRAPPSLGMILLPTVRTCDHFS